MSAGKPDFATLLKRAPLVVGAIAEAELLNRDPAEFHHECDLIELRLDSLGAGPEVVEFARTCPLPLLITSRGKAEGGAGSWTVSERAGHYRHFLKYAALIDIEVSQFSELEEVRRGAEREKIPVLGSFHDYGKTPPLTDLKRIAEKAGPLFKVATLTHTETDLETLLNLLAAGKFRSVMGMGPLGVSARPQMAARGSLLNYGYLGETPTAPGQWQARELLKAIRGNEAA